MLTISLAGRVTPVRDMVTDRGLIESCWNRIDHSVLRVSMSLIIKYLSQAVQNNFRHTRSGVADMVSVIDDFASSLLPLVAYFHLGFQRFFTFAALIVIIFLPSLFVLVLISMSHFISTVERGISICTVSPSLFLPVYDPLIS